MRIATGVTASSWVGQVTSEIAEILLHFRFGSASYGDLQDIVSMMDSVLVSIAYVSNGNSIRHSHQVPLTVIADYQAAFEGVFSGNQDVAGGVMDDLRVSVPLCSSGSLVLSGDEQIQIQLTGLPADASDELDIYGLEMPTRDVELVQFKKLIVPADEQDKTFRLNDYELLLIEPSDFDELLLSYSNGNTCKYTPAELIYLSEKTNELAVHFRPSSIGSLTDASLPGYISYVAFDVSSVTSVQCLRAAGGAVVEMYGIHSTVVAAPAPVVAVNNNLTDTTLEKKVVQAEQAVVK
ncbi:MAG: hypothetical protein MI974_19050 [Chitinophagales bacterium]|nr:hypothetical protein [Chitinophagales bacterium]